jgi:transposase
MVEREVGRRRRWRADDKGRIVAESYVAEAIVSEVARRHDITPQQLFAWRKAARTGHLTLPSQEAPMVVPAMTTMRDGGADATANTAGSIVIEIGGVTVRAQRGVDLGWLRDVLRAVKAAK